MLAKKTPTGLHDWIWTAAFGLLPQAQHTDRIIDFCKVKFSDDQIMYPSSQNGYSIFADLLQKHVTFCDSESVSLSDKTDIAFHHQAIYTNKIGDCLFIYLFVYLSICSAIGGQTARPKRLKFGG